MWNDPSLLNKAEFLIELLPNLLKQDKNLDIIGGVSGCILSLISLYNSRPSEHILSTAVQCGDHLITNAKTMQKGIAWRPSMGEQPLTGFSHGAAGIALSLLKLANLTGQTRFHKTALAAIEYERSLFCSEVRNWPDLRNFSDAVLSKNNSQTICQTAWCHGAPGIGLARLQSLPYLDDPEIRSEISTALQTTLEHGFGDNHSLCHGDMGNLELLIQAAQILNETRWKTELGRLSTIIVNGSEENGWVCGVPFGIETPGLMTGLAGIGYQLLRLAAPDRVPSVLTLEPPKLQGTVSPNTEQAIAEE